MLMSSFLHLETTRLMLCKYLRNTLPSAARCQLESGSPSFGLGAYDNPPELPGLLLPYNFLEDMCLACL